MLPERHSEAAPSLPIWRKLRSSSEVREANRRETITFIGSDTLAEETNACSTCPLLTLACIRVNWSTGVEPLLPFDADFIHRVAAGNILGSYYPEECPVGQVQRA